MKTLDYKHFSDLTMSDRAVAMSLGLNGREMQVWKLGAMGLSAKEIGAAVGTARETVEKQMQSLGQKLGRLNPIERTHLAIWFGVVEVCDFRRPLLNAKPQRRKGARTPVFQYPQHD